MDAKSSPQRDRTSRTFSYVPAPEKVFSFVPDEICVVVSTTGAQSPSDVYRQVQDALNTTIGAKIPQPGNGGSKAAHVVDRDLRPSAVWERCRVSREGLFQPVDRAGIEPSVHFDSADDAKSAMLHVYKIGLDAARHDTGKDDPGDRGFLPYHQVQTVRDLVNLVNREFARQPPDDKAHGWQIVSASPNWLGDIAGMGGPGPGTPPMSVPLPSRRSVDQVPPFGWDFKFSDAITNQARAAQQAAANPAGRVVVAILDTSPTQDQFDRAVQGKTFNRLLQALAAGQKIGIDEAPGLTMPGDFQHLKNFIPAWPGALARQWIEAPQPRDKKLSDETYNMRDHGLFVAGIIRNIAPTAEIHLIRVFSDLGVGDWFAIAQVLRRLPDKLKIGEKDRLIVNLSATVDMLTSEDVMKNWFINTGKSAAASRQPWSDVAKTMKDVEASLTTATDWLRKRGVLVVAAVGNRGLGAKHRPEPRYPAHIDSVLGVAAVNSSDHASSFSNLGDEALPDAKNGIATFGGNATIRHDRPAITLRGNHQPDAVFGVCCQDPLPFSGEKNESGYVSWAGTSFATPIISALAANYWMTNLGIRDPEQIIAYLQSLATRPVSALLVNAIPAEQVQG